MLGRLLGNNTPPYQGQTQRANAKGGGLLSFFTGGFALFPKTPVYATASPDPVATPMSTTGEPSTDAATSPSEDAPIDEEHETGAEEPETKRVTIIVTPGSGTTVEDVAAFFRERCGLDG